MVLNKNVIFRMILLENFRIIGKRKEGLDLMNQLILMTFLIIYHVNHIMLLMIF